jgi:surfactin family lipopeptide synthetase A
MPIAQASDAQRRRVELYLRENQPRVSLAADTAVPQRSSSVPAPLSFPQEQIFRRAQENADQPPFYNECITVHRTGSLDVPALERSLLEIIRRHEIWRTTYDIADGRPVQIVHPVPGHFSLPMIDLRRLPELEQQAEVLRSIRELTEPPFDLRRGPLLRFLLVTTNESAHRLFLVAHQSIVDGVSVYQVFPRELSALYQAFSEGNPSPLPELPVQFGDYAGWQRRQFDAEKIEEQADYWRKQLGGELPILRWPAEGAGSRTSTYRGLIRSFAFSKDLTAALKATAPREGATVFMVLLSGFVALLQYYTSLKGVIVSTLSPAGRKRSELQNLLGYFLNPVMLRFDLSSDPEFRDLLRQTRAVVSEAISHDDLPFEVLAEKAKCASGPSCRPFPDVAISLQPSVPETVRAGWDITSMDVGSGGSPWDLYLAFIDGRDGMIGRAQYNPDVFDEETITGVLRDLEASLVLFTSQPQARLSDLAKFIEKG